MASLTSARAVLRPHRVRRLHRERAGYAQRGAVLGLAQGPPGDLEVSLPASVQLTNSQIKVLRRRWGDRLFAFAPANDLSVVSRSLDLGDRRISRKGQTEVEGGKVLGDEWAEHVVKNRSGIMLRASWVLFSPRMPLTPPGLSSSAICGLPTPLRRPRVCAEPSASARLRTTVCTPPASPPRRPSRRSSALSSSARRISRRSCGSVCARSRSS